MGNRNAGRAAREAGYTAVEALTVVAVMGAVAALTGPSINRFRATQDVQKATAQVGGMLQQIRARAIQEGIPQLVLVQQEDVSGRARSPFALIVRDNDRSYSLTPPDDVQTFTLDADLRPEVRQYGVAPESRFEDLKVSDEEADALQARYEAWASDPANSGSGASGCSGRGPCLDPAAADYQASMDPANSAYDPASIEANLRSASDATENGSTFPSSSDAGVPAIAFNEQGIAVSLDSPGQWGSGAGSIYLTDNQNAVYAASVSPMGEVSLSRYDTESGSWKR
jgi:type II secretory pathway pseudopilin PulG